LQFDDGSTADFWVRGGRADPNLRMPSARLAITWRGQDEDWTGPGPSVGPDGLQDVHLALPKLSPQVEVRSIPGMSSDNTIRWQFGTNPQGDGNAEFVRDSHDPGRGDLFFQPDRDLTGQTLQVTVTYANGKSDSAGVTAGPTDPRRTVPPTLLPVLVPS